MSKLVRDKIPEIIRQNNKSPITEILDARCYAKALNDKLLEEVREFIEAVDGDDTEAMHEIADIMEVLDALIVFKKYDRHYISAYKDKKRLERGGFEKRILLKDSM